VTLDTDDGEGHALFLPLLSGVAPLFGTSLCTSSSSSTSPKSFSFVARTYLERILETQPWLTLSCLEMSHGRTPLCANSTIRCRTTSGRGRPLTKTPPSWFTPPWPEIEAKLIEASEFAAKNKPQPEVKATPQSIK